MTKVSVLMSVYNGERYLREAIESILNQTFSDFEFIIINDGSTDRSSEIVQSYNDPRIRYLENDQNVGLIRSLNRGLSLARSPYIARMDADDVSLPERLAKQVNFLDAHPEVGVLGTVVQFMDAYGNRSAVWQCPEEHGLIKWCLFFYNPIAHVTVMMRRELVNQVGGYGPDMVHSEDFDLWRRLSRMTRFSNLQDTLLYVRNREDGLRSKYSAQQQKNGIRISQQMMSEVLDEDIPVEVVQRLWSREFATSNDVLQVARLIYRLCRASVTDSELSATERRAIRSDAARRLCNLVHPYIHDVRMWKVLSLACLLDPVIARKAAISLLRHMVRKGFAC